MVVTGLSWLYCKPIPTRPKAAEWDAFQEVPWSRVVPYKGMGLLMPELSDNYLLSSAWYGNEDYKYDVNDGLNHYSWQREEPRVPWQGYLPSYGVTLQTTLANGTPEEGWYLVNIHNKIFPMTVRPWNVKKYTDNWAMAAFSAGDKP